MSDLKVDGFKVIHSPVLAQPTPSFHSRFHPQASDILSKINATFDGFTPAERAAQIKKVNSSSLRAFLLTQTHPVGQTAAVFELRITNAQNQEAVWTIDLKDKGTVYKGPVRAPAKAGVTLLMTDDTFEQLAVGKVCALSLIPPRHPDRSFIWNRWTAKRRS